MSGMACAGVLVRRKSVPDSATAIVWIHGGGFAFGSPRTHRAAAAACLKRPNVRCGFPITLSAPEHPHPAALDALDRVPSGEPMDIVGDSAGGNLALCWALRRKGRLTGSSCFLLGSTCGWTVLPPSETNPATAPSTGKTCGNTPVSTSPEKHPHSPIAVRSSPRRRPCRPWGPSCWSIRTMSCSRRIPWPSPPPAERRIGTSPTPLAQGCPAWMAAVSGSLAGSQTEHRTDARFPCTALTVRPSWVHLDFTHRVHLAGIDRAEFDFRFSCHLGRFSQW